MKGNIIVLTDFFPLAHPKQNLVREETGSMLPSIELDVYLVDKKIFKLR